MSAAAVLETALELAKEGGLPLFPCRHTDKRPYTEHGFKDATTDPKQITAWWRRWPGALVGVPTGHASGLLVIDTDPSGAAWHHENHDRLACGRVHRTRRGHHLLYRYPPNTEIRNSAGRIAPGVDVRGEGGYIVWWPAHGLQAIGGMEDVYAPPGWLVAELTNGASPEAQGAGAYISEGQRNGFLSGQAFKLRKQGCTVAQIAEVLQALNHARCSPPLPDVEVVGIANGKARVPPDEAPKSPAGDGFSSAIVALEIGDLLAREFPPKEMLLTPWLRKQDLLMFYAKRGVGKTHFSLSLAYAVASGGKFLKWQAPMARRVLYIDGEMPGVAIKERLAAIVEASEAEPPEGYFRIVTPDVQPIALPDLATAEGQSALEPLIGDAQLIVLDNLSTLMRHGVENEGESWIPMATWALTRRREGRSVVFVHHAGKGGQQRGSSRREDLLDTVICLKHPSDYSPEQGARFEVVFEKSRGLCGKDVETIEAVLQEGADGKTSWTWTAAGATVDRVAELQGIGMKPAEIAGELGVHRSTVYRALKGRQGGG